MAKPRQKAVISCRVRESLLFYGESLEFWGKIWRIYFQTSIISPPPTTNYFSEARGAPNEQTHKASLVGYQGLHHRLWPVLRYQMEDSIVVSGRPYSIRDGLVTNVRA